MLALFQDGNILEIDPATGTTTQFASLFANGQNLIMTTAITLDNGALLIETECLF